MANTYLRKDVTQDLDDLAKANPYECAGSAVALCIAAVAWLYDIEVNHVYEYASFF